MLVYYITAQTVGVHVIETVHPVAVHAEGGQAMARGTVCSDWIHRLFCFGEDTKT